MQSCNFSVLFSKFQLHLISIEIHTWLRLTFQGNNIINAKDYLILNQMLTNNLL